MSTPEPGVPALTLYYDGSCPFCASEMRRLVRWNGGHRLAFVDIASPGFDPALLGVSMQVLGVEMHGRTSEGRMLLGLDAVMQAYDVVGQGWRIAPLRIRPLRAMLAPLYRAFARNRHAMSRLLGYRNAGNPGSAGNAVGVSTADKATCDGDHCSVHKVW